MLDSGISAREIFEVFIPAAARQLGRCWVQNTLSFAEVTLAIILASVTRGTIISGISILVFYFAFQIVDIVLYYHHLLF